MDDKLRVALLRMEQGTIARNALHSVFSVEVNLHHLLPGGFGHDNGKRRYYLRTHEVDPTLPKTPEEEEEAAAPPAGAEAKKEQSRVTRSTTRKATGKTKSQEDEEWNAKKSSSRKGKEKAQEPSRREGKGTYGFRKRNENPVLYEILKNEAAEEGGTTKTMRKKERASQEPSNEEETSKNGIKNSRRNDGERHSTGFVIASQPQGSTLRILTCAHTIDEIYGPGHHDISAEEVNEFFSFEVHCSHQESRILDQLNGRPINEQERLTTGADVVALDTARDLMILEINSGEIHLSDEQMCPHRHQPLDLVEHPLTEAEVCVLQGWPPQQMASLSFGQLSYRHRTYEAITQLNVKGYTMRLAEFTKLEGDEGSSGGPAVNGEGRYVGVYHGVIGTKAYVISQDDVTQFLQENAGVLANWPAVTASSCADHENDG